MTDELRGQIRRLDPQHPGVPTEPVTAQPARQLLEHIMSTPSPDRQDRAQRPRRAWYAVATVALAGVVAVGVFTLFDGTDVAPDTTTTVVALPPLELGLGEGGAMAKCMVVSADILGDMSPALLGTVTAVDGEKVTLTVDRWYAGDEAQQVILHAPAGLQALIGGIDFQVGSQYFVTASDGVVNYCGFSDVYSPELAAIYAEAFGA